MKECFNRFGGRGTGLGFTLIELLVTIAIIAITTRSSIRVNLALLFMIYIPSFWEVAFL